MRESVFAVLRQLSDASVNPQLQCRRDEGAHAGEWNRARIPAPDRAPQSLKRSGPSIRTKAGNQASNHPPILSNITHPKQGVLPPATITQPFLMDVNEVTVAQFRQFNPALKKNDHRQSLRQIQMTPPRFPLQSEM